MPGLGQYAIRIVGSQIVNDGGHFIAVGNFESATGAEIIVHIDDQQAVVCTAPLIPVLDGKRITYSRVMKSTVIWLLAYNGRHYSHY